MNRHDEILTNIYHRGQEKVWDGRNVLDELLAKYGGCGKMEPQARRSLNRILTMILRGEEAAWKISLQLGSMLDTTPARLAATSQAHDEARHFYVMRDYLKLTKQAPVTLPKSIDQALNAVISTDSLPKKLLGMQLMVEPVALTIFQEIRKSELEPVLCELLPYYERDEARHVALGVHYLPTLMKDMVPLRFLSLAAWQYRLFMLELHGLRDMRADFHAIGLDPNHLFALAEQKQLKALEDVAGELGWGPSIWKPLQTMLRYQKHRILG